MNQPQPHRLGVLGGMFDPIHNGHLAAATHARHVLGLNQVKLIPCHHPNHRSPPAANANHRLKMARLAVEFETSKEATRNKRNDKKCADMTHQNANTPNKTLEVDPIELDRPGISYTVDTLATLHSRHPNTTMVFILGHDAFTGITNWHQWQRILELTHLFVLPRQQSAEPAGPDDPDWLRQHRRATPADLFSTSSGGIYLDKEFTINISSTTIRQYLAKDSGEYAKLLPPPVLSYIHHHKLYGTKAAITE